MNDMTTTNDANDSTAQWPYFVVTDYNGRLVSHMFLPLLLLDVSCCISARLILEHYFVLLLRNLDVNYVWYQ
jgi:hypothetical protein